LLVSKRFNMATDYRDPQGHRDSTVRG